MDYIRTELHPGVMLTCVDPKRHKTDAIFVNFILPLSARNASSLSLISKVLVQGTASYPTFRTLSTACDDNYACGIDAFTFKQGESICLSFSLSCLKNEYALHGEDIFSEGLRLLGEVIFSPYLREGCFFRDYVNREKNVLKEQMLSLINNKPAYALRQAISLMCKDEIYSVPSYGDLSSLEGLDAKILTEIYWNTLNSAPVEIIYAGGCEKQSLICKINEYLPFSSRKYILPGVRYIEKADGIKEHTERADASQSTIVLGFRTGGYPWSKDFAAFTVFNEIFALSPVSKLFMNVREKLSLCYYCNSFADRLKGIMTVSAGIDRQNFRKIKKAILDELEAIKTGNVTDDEYNSAVRSAVSAYKEISDHPGQLCSYYFTRILQGGISTPEEEIERLHSLPSEEAVKAAQRITLDTVFLLEGTNS